jgi:hypothetical protein
MSVYGRGLLLAVETLLVELLEDDEGTFEDNDDEDTAEDDDEDAAELVELDDAGKILDDVVGAAELLLLGATEVLGAAEEDKNKELNDIVDDNEGD